MAVNPNSPVACTISSTGISAPVYSDILNYLVTQYQSIFGSDAYLTSDSQDYQLLAVFANAINDSNNATVATYNSFSPNSAQGVGLSNVVKINGITRQVATNSTATVTIIGVAGTIVNNGIVADTTNNQYALPSQVIIPFSGTITILAICTQVGSIISPAGSITNIITPTLGWQSVSNIAASTPGNPVETDAQLRIRQTNSTAYPALAVLESLEAAVANVSGVTQSIVYENYTSTSDINGIPGHSISVVVQGGDPVQVATAIAQRKTPGTGTYGTTTETIQVGNISTTINFFEVQDAILTATITIVPKTGYTTLIGQGIQSALVNYISQLSIGQEVEYAQCIAACVGPTYRLESIAFTLNSVAQTLGADIPITFNNIATLTLANTTLVI